MTDSQADPQPTRTTFVERTLKQPVKEAVREALAEHDAVRTADRSDADGESGSTSDPEGSGATDADDNAASRDSSAVRFLLLAGAIGGAAYAVFRHRGSEGDGSAETESSSGAAGDTDETATDDEPDDSDEVDEADDADSSSLRDVDADSDSQIPEGDRHTAPAEDATAN
jgi:hypothetical protein